MTTELNPSPYPSNPSLAGVNSTNLPIFCPEFPSSAKTRSLYTLSTPSHLSFSKYHCCSTFLGPWHDFHSSSFLCLQINEGALRTASGWYVFKFPSDSNMQTNVENHLPKSPVISLSVCLPSTSL